MSGEKNLETLIYAMDPVFKDGEFVIISIKEYTMELMEVNPIAMFHEEEGTTLVISKLYANELKIEYETAFRLITLNIHSSLTAVGFIAKISTLLAEYNISVNVISAFYHDHLLIPSDDADRAMELLKKLRDNFIMIM